MEPTKQMKKGIFHRIQHCDPRYIYLFFFLTVVLFVVISEKVNIPMPIGTTIPVRKLYDKIEAAPPDKLVIIDSDWRLDIRAESEGQMRAVLEHMMRRKVKFALLSWIDNPQGQKNGYDLTTDVAQKYGYEYGKDWVAWGAIKKSGGATIQAMAKDIKGTVKSDINGVPLKDIPVMKNTDDIFDIYLIFSVCYNYEDTPWLGFVQGVYNTNYAIGVSAIASSTAYAYLETGQICGMLVSAPGASEYEELLDMPSERRFAKKKVIVLSMAIVYILIVIALGNISYYSSLRRERKWQS